MAIFKTMEKAEKYALKSCFHPVIEPIAGKHNTKYKVYDRFDDPKKDGVERE